MAEGDEVEAALAGLEDQLPGEVDHVGFGGAHELFAEGGFHGGEIAVAADLDQAVGRVDAALDAGQAVADGHDQLGAAARDDEVAGLVAELRGEAVDPEATDLGEIVLHVELQQRIGMGGAQQRCEFFAQEQGARLLAVGEGRKLRPRAVADRAVAGGFAVERCVVHDHEAAVGADLEVELHRGAEAEAVFHHRNGEFGIGEGAAKPVPFEPGGVRTTGNRQTISGHVRDPFDSCWARH